MSLSLDILNESQRTAVEYCDGPQLVIAGAGSGKTRVLTMKVAYLLTHGYQPQEIIALTFTKKAATEMQQRIQQLVGAQSARRLWMGTFHSLFSRILRREAERIGFKSDFTIYDQTDSRSLVKAIVKEMELDEKLYKPNTVQAVISNAKNNLITPNMYAQNRELRGYDEKSGHGRIHEIYSRYWSRCLQAGAMDFDDLLLYTNILFRDHPEVLEFYQQYFSYVLVDEYQDTNRAQHLIVEQLARRHGHLCVVGDDAQSIYSFRGANIRNILDMQRQIPGTRIFKLEQNYRSTQTIVNAANSLIAKNTEQIPKRVFSERDEGTKLQLTGTCSDLEESYVVAKRIEQLRDEGYPLRDIAILYRTNAQSRTFEEALRKKGLDYRIYGGLSFYQRKEIKDIVSYLRLIINPADEEAFKRVINYPARGIGDTTVGKIAAVIAQQSATFFDVCSSPESYDLQVNKGTATKLRNFAAQITHFQQLNQQLNAYELTESVIFESGIKGDLAQDMSVEGQSRRENVNELLSAIQTFVLSAVEQGTEARLIDFLADISLSGDVEPQGHDAGDEVSDYVSLMTMHSAKGLEFKNVFVVGLEEGLIPSDMSRTQVGGMEEERRLLYVAITRAEDHCFLSYATSRFRNGKSDVSRPSQFLKDIDRKYIQQANSASVSGLESYSRMGGGNFGWRKEDAWTRAVWHHPADPEPKPTSPKVDPATVPPPFSGRVSHIKHAPVAHTEGQRKAAPTVSSITYNGIPLRAGTHIQHDRFGHGVVSQLESDSNGNDRITVQFDSMGVKTLLLKFAKFKVVE